MDNDDSGNVIGILFLLWLAVLAIIFLVFAGGSMP